MSIFGVVSIAFNGYVIGFILEKSVLIDGLGVLWKLVPHGIFELPAIFISFGLVIIGKATTTIPAITTPAINKINIILSKFLEELEKGPMGARVDFLKSQEIPEKSGEADFGWKA